MSGALVPCGSASMASRPSVVGAVPTGVKMLLRSVSNLSVADCAGADGAEGADGADGCGVRAGVAGAVGALAAGAGCTVVVGCARGAVRVGVGAGGAVTVTGGTDNVPGDGGGAPGCSAGCGGAGVAPGAAAGGSVAGGGGAGAVLFGCSGSLSCCASCGCDAETPAQQLRNTSEAPLRSSQRLLRMDTFDSRSFSFENEILSWFSPSPRLRSQDCADADKLRQAEVRERRRMQGVRRAMQSAAPTLIDAIARRQPTAAGPPPRPALVCWPNE